MIKKPPPSGGGAFTLVYSHPLRRMILTYKDNVKKDEVPVINGKGLWGGLVMTIPVKVYDEDGRLTNTRTTTEMIKGPGGLLR